MNPFSNQKNLTLLLLALLFVKSVFMIGVIQYAGVELGPDEAQYWTWSKSLDWGYYSKPPAIAWQIAAGTSLFGNSELGVRFISVILSFLQAFSLYFLAFYSGLPILACFWSAIIIAFSPIGIFGSLFAVTDGGFLLFWTLSCVITASALAQNKGVNPLLLGITIGIGSLFKWPIYAFWVIFMICRFRFFPRQKYSILLAGLLISLLGLLPSIWWNSQHDFATFRHVFATIGGGSMKHASNANPLSFIGSQAALLSPILFFLFLAAYLPFFKKYRQINDALKFCGWTSLAGILLFIGLSFFQKIQGNWSLMIYPTAIVVLSWAFTEIKNGFWLKMGVGLSVLLTAFTLSIPSLQPFFPSLYKINPFKHNMGWIELKKQLQEIGYDPNSQFLVSDKYQTTSLLSFYSEKQKRAYFLNLQGVRRNQFSYWPKLQDAEEGKSGYFVWIENAPRWQRDSENQKSLYQKPLEDYFAKVELEGEAPLISTEERILKGALIFKCTAPKQKEEASIESY